MDDNNNKVTLETFGSLRNVASWIVFAYRGQVSACQSATLQPISCKSVQPVPARVDEPVSPVRQSSSGGEQSTLSPRCPKPAWESRLSKLTYTSAQSAAGWKTRKTTTACRVLKHQVRCPKYFWKSPRAKQTWSGGNFCWFPTNLVRHLLPYPSLQKTKTRFASLVDYNVERFHTAMLWIWICFVGPFWGGNILTYHRFLDGLWNNFVAGILSSALRRLSWALFRMLEWEEKLRREEMIIMVFLRYVAVVMLKQLHTEQQQILPAPVACKKSTVVVVRSRALMV